MSDGRLRVVSRDLLKEIRQQFQLDWAGAHGYSHWARVYRHGMHVGRAAGADLRVVELFAFLHDSRRQDEYEDPEHGLRAADYVRWLHGRGRFDANSQLIEQLLS